MSWPMSQDYDEAIQYPMDCVTDPELQNSEAVTNRLGLPVPCSGNFADVYAMTSGSRKWAVKCFTRQIPGLKERYAAVSAYLQQTPLPFMVDFRFLEQGIYVRGQWFPILKMQWVEGLAPNAFVRENLDKPQILDGLCQIWLKLASRLREASIAHCDLQHGNVLLVQGARAGSMGVRLVDYDGMCVPALELLKSIELGHPAYQHPQRLREGTYGLQIDRFPHLVIYTAIRAIMVGGKGLWQKYDNGDNLLFRQADLESPRTSALFQELLKLNDPQVKKLAQAIAIGSQNPIDRVPLLEQLVEVPKPKPALPTIQAVTPQRTDMCQPPAPAVESPFAAVSSESGKLETKRRPRHQASPKRGLLIGGLAIVGLLVGAAGLYFALRPDPRPQAVVLARGTVLTEHVAQKRQSSHLLSPLPTAHRPKTNPDTITEPRPNPAPKAEPKLQPEPVPEPKPKNMPDPEPKTQPVLDKGQSIQSFNYPRTYVRHRDGLGYATEIRTDPDRKDASWHVCPGIAGGDAVSFRSVNFPKQYLRHQGGRIKLHDFEDADLFKMDATFRQKPGLANRDWSSFESLNCPNHYIRHRGGELCVEKNDGSQPFAMDATFRLVSSLNSPAKAEPKRVRSQNAVKQL